MLVTKPQPMDLAKYYESDNYISHTDSNRSLFESTYQIVKSFAIQKKLRLIEGVGNKGSLLDIGAGTADFAVAAQKAEWQVTATEPSLKAREAACGKGIFPVSDTADLENKSFDVITMWHVLEHVRDPRKQVAELSRLIKPNGTIIIAVPNFKSYDAQHYKEFWAGYDVPRHLFHYSKESIAGLFAEQQMKVDKILPMSFDAFYVSLLSEKYKSGRMNVIKALMVGIKSNLKAIKTKEASSHIYLISKKSPYS